MGVQRLRKFIDGLTFDRISMGNTNPGVVYIDANNLLHDLFHYEFGIKEPIKPFSYKLIYEFYYQCFEQWALHYKNVTKFKFYFDGMKEEKKDDVLDDRMKKNLQKYIDSTKDTIADIPNNTRLILVAALDDLNSKSNQCKGKFEVILTDREADFDIALDANEDQDCIGVVSKDTDFYILCKKCIVFDKLTINESSSNGTCRFELSGIRRIQLYKAIVKRFQEIQQTTCREIKSSDVKHLPESFAKKLLQNDDSEYSFNDDQLNHIIALLYSICDNDFMKFDSVIMFRKKICLSKPEFPMLLGFVLSFVESHPNAKIEEMFKQISNDPKIMESAKHSYNVAMGDKDKVLKSENIWKDIEDKIPNLKKRYRRYHLDPFLTSIMIDKKIRQKPYMEKFNENIDSLEFWKPITMTMYRYIFFNILDIRKKTIKLTEVTLNGEESIIVKGDKIPLCNTYKDKGKAKKLLLFRLLSGLLIPTEQITYMMDHEFEIQEKKRFLKDYEMLIIILIRTIKRLCWKHNQKDRFIKLDKVTRLLSSQILKESSPMEIECSFHNGVDNNLALYERGAFAAHLLNDLLDRPISFDQLKSLFIELDYTLYNNKNISNKFLTEEMINKFLNDEETEQDQDKKESKTVSTNLYFSEVWE